MGGTAYDQLIAAKRELHGITLKRRQVERKINRLRTRVLSKIQPFALSKLSVREREVCDCLIVGMANKEIAYKLNISVRTAKFHVSKILKKFGMQSRAQIFGMVQ